LDQLFGWPDDDSLETKHVAVSILLCNKLSCSTETYILYEYVYWFTVAHDGPCLAKERRRYWKLFA